MPIFVFPLAFLGMLAVPAAAAIYLLRSRSRRRPVSSLMLWTDQQQAKEGGLILQRMRTPILLLLELLTVVFLVIAATNPRIRKQQARRPLMVVLDDSYSMQAGGKNSPRQQAQQALEDYLDDGAGYPVRFILAGRNPQALGEPIYAVSQAPALLKEWRGLSPSADLAGSIALAGAIGEAEARILVLTDHPPQQEIKKGRLEWWAFGRPYPNVAFVNATRTAGSDQGRCLLEIANLWPHRQKTSLIIQGLDGSNRGKRMDLDLAGSQVRRLLLKVPAQTGPLRAHLINDTLTIDNEIVLLPRVRKTVRVDLRIDDKTIHKAVTKALQATGEAIVTNQRPDLVITDRPVAGAGISPAWLVRIIVERDAAAFVGPFVMDNSHPLTWGLSLEGVVWGAGKSEKVPGVPVITAGNVPLVTDTERLNGIHELRIRLRVDLSTVTNSPNWPILMWNLLRYRASSDFGLHRTNVRIGTDVIFRPRPDAENLRVLEPGGKTRKLPLRGRNVAIRARSVGIHEVRTNKGRYAFASNAMCSDESDLRQCATGRWGNWLDETAMRVEYKGIAWVFLLLALAALVAHMALVSGRQRGMQR